MIIKKKQVKLSIKNLQSIIGKRYLIHTPYLKLMSGEFITVLSCDNHTNCITVKTDILRDFNYVIPIGDFIRIAIKLRY